MNLYSRILHHLENWEMDEPFASEYDLEQRLARHLAANGISTSTQQRSKKGRHDIVCTENDSRVCIELKIKADTSNVKQFDRYHAGFADGFIILCWKASGPLQEIFDSVEKQSPTPIALFELSKRYSMV